MSVIHLNGRSTIPFQKPKLYRLAKYVGWASTLALVAIIVYVIAAVFSLATSPPGFTFGSGGSGNGSNNVCTNSTSSITCDITLTNKGSFPITASIAMTIHQSPGPLIAQGSAGPVTVSNGASKVLSLTVNYITTPSPGSKYILWAWLNASYAYFVGISIGISLNGTFNSTPSALAHQIPAVEAEAGGIPSRAPMSMVQSSSQPIGMHRVTQWRYYLPTIKQIASTGGVR